MENVQRKNKSLEIPNSLLFSLILYDVKTQFNVQKPSLNLHKYSSIRLTTRKLQCLICLAQGMTRSEIAKKLGISYATVNQHLIALRWRLRFSSIKDMLEALRSSGWVMPSSR